MRAPHSWSNARRQQIRSLLSLFILVAAACAAGAQVTPVGGELQVNTYFTGNQQRPAAAMAASGGFVVVWESRNQDHDDYGVFARRFDAAGVALASEFQVNVRTIDVQHEPRVAIDGTGNFVVVWASYLQDGSLSGVFARRFNAAGAAQGAEFQVNVHTAGGQTQPAVATDGDGDFVVAWQSDALSGGQLGIFARRFDSGGTPQGGEIEVDTVLTGGAFSADVAVNAGGDFVVSWTKFSGDGDASAVLARRFDSAGNAQTGAILVNAYSVGVQGSPSVAIDDSGQFVVVWHSDGQDGAGYGVFARRFDSGATALGGEQQVNIYTSGHQRFPQVELDGDGDFVVVWGSSAQDGSGYGVFARRFGAAGAALGGELQVNTYTPNAQRGPALVVAPGGDFVVAWQSTVQDGSQYGVRAQRFSVPSAFDIDGNGSVDALTDGLLFLRYAFGFRGATLMNGAIALNCGRCTQGPLEAFLAGISVVTRVDRAGPEFQVNSYTGDNQQLPVVATDDDFDFVVAWQSPHDASSLGLFGRRFSSTGSPVAPEFQVNGYISDKQYLPAAARDADGDFVVAWASYLQDGSGYGVFARRFNSAGAAQAAEFQVNTYTPGYQSLPAVAMSPAGNFVMVWQSSDLDGSNYGVFARRFNASGSPQGAEFQVNTYTPDNQRFADVALDGAGNFVVVWESNLEDGSGSGIFARRFDATGVPQGGELQVNTYTTSAQSQPAVDLDSAGSFVVAWHSSGEDGSANGIFARRFTSAGAPQATEFQVNSYTADNQSFAALAFDGDGNFVVTWTSFGQDGDSVGIFGRRFDAAGTPLASELQINSYATSEQSFPDVAADTAGDFVVVWESLRDGSGRGIFGQRFAAGRPGDIDGNGTVEALTDGLLALRYMFGFRGATLVTGAVGPGCKRCTATAIESYLAAKV